MPSVVIFEVSGRCALKVEGVDQVIFVESTTLPIPRFFTETTLYNRQGQASAYIAQDGETIYLWDGRAVAYLDGDKVYGWNGKHLGWYSGGLIYDLNGRRTGCISNNCPYGTYAEPAKYAKRVKYVKYVQYVPYVRPVFSFNWSNKPLKTFLEEGSVT